MIQDFRLLDMTVAERPSIALEVRDENLNTRTGDDRRISRIVAANTSDPPSSRSSRFTEVITAVLKSHRLDRFSDPERFHQIKAGGLARFDVTKRASSGAELS